MAVGLVHGAGVESSAAHGGQNVVLHVNGAVGHGCWVAVVEGMHVDPPGRVGCDFGTEGQGGRGDGDQGGQHGDFGVRAAVGAEPGDTGVGVDAGGDKVFEYGPGGRNDLTDEPDDQPDPPGQPGQRVHGVSTA